MTIAITLAGMLVLLLVKGFFSGSEIAIVSADRVKLRAKAAGGSSGARLALKLLGDPARLLTTTLLGTNISSTALTTVGTILIVGIVGGDGELVALILFTPLFLIFGEIVPKSIYQQKSDELAPWIVYPLSWLQIVLAPLVWFFSGIARFAARLVGGDQDAAEATREQFMATVQMAETTGAVAAFSHGQVRRVLRTAQMTAAEAMWPLGSIHCLSRDADVADLIAMRREGEQRIVPLYERTQTNVVAIAVVEVWDLLDPAVGERDMESFIGPVRFVPHVQRMSEVIEILHGAPDLTVVVVDDVGATLGIITLNLLVRHTLGAKISPVTERGGGRGDYRRLDDGQVVFDARTPVARVNDKLGISLPMLEHSTLGGFALMQFGHLPQVGESFEAEGLRFTVTEATERAILGIRVSRQETGAGSGA